jgi:hypothetical protein
MIEGREMVSPDLMDVVEECGAPPFGDAQNLQEQQLQRTSLQVELDQLAAILAAEHTYRVPHIPCTAMTSDPSRLPYGEWRKKICQWSFKVIDHFRFDREVVSAALNIFDRYLAAAPRSLDTNSCPCPACQRSVDSRTFQLTAMTSLYLAMKMASDCSSPLCHSTTRKLRLASFVELSRGQFCADDICRMEESILAKLKWKIHPPTPMSLVIYLLNLMPLRSAIPWPATKRYDLVLHVLHECSRYLTELSVCLGDRCSIYSSSQVAYAAILVSMEFLTYEALPQQVRDAFNKAVVSMSMASGGTALAPNHHSIIILQECLRQSFWPEMLLEDCKNSDTIGEHPIRMARGYGLLDASFSAPHHHHHYSTSPQTQQQGKVSTAWQGSPVSVLR